MDLGTPAMYSSSKPWGLLLTLLRFIAGLLFKQTRDADRVVEKASTIAYSFFTPIFFLSIGIQSQLNQLGDLWGFAIVVALVSVVTKVLGCGGGACLTGMNVKQGLRVGIGMISRGEVALITASIGLKSGMLSPKTYSVIVLMVLATTIATPPFLKLSFNSTRPQTQALNVSK